MKTGLYEDCVYTWRGGAVGVGGRYSLRGVMGFGVLGGKYSRCGVVVGRRGEENCCCVGGY